MITTCHNKVLASFTAWDYSAAFDKDCLWLYDLYLCIDTSSWARLFSWLTANLARFEFAGVTSVRLNGVLRCGEVKFVLWRQKWKLLRGVSVSGFGCSMFWQFLFPSGWAAVFFRRQIILLLGFDKRDLPLLHNWNRNTGIESEGKVSGGGKWMVQVKV